MERIILNHSLYRANITLAETTDIRGRFVTFIEDVEGTTYNAHFFDDIDDARDDYETRVYNA